MEIDLIIGIVGLCTAVISLVSLTFWARAIIHRMAREKFSSARAAIKEMNLG